MKAILTASDRSLHWSEVPTPEIAADEVLVRVCAAGINRADLMQRAGNYPPPPGCPDWMGLEVSGYIEKMGEQAQKESTLKVGDAVCALLGGGGYAEYVAVRYDMCIPVPAGFSMIEAAAIPEAYATSYLKLFYEGGLREGDTVLITAGGSGLASVMIPMARAFGIRVLTTVRSEKEKEAIAHLCADRVICTDTEDLAEVLRTEVEAGHGINAAVDCLGGDVVGKCLPFMERGGRWIMIATLAGDTTTVDMRMLYVKGVRLVGSTLRSRAPEVKAEILRRLSQEVLSTEKGRTVRPTIFATMPITEAEAGHALLEQGKSVGKVVLTL